MRRLVPTRCGLSPMALGVGAALALGSLGLAACGTRRPPDLPEPSYRQNELPPWSPPGSSGTGSSAKIGGAGGASGSNLPDDGAILGSDIWEVEGQWVTDEAQEDSRNPSTEPPESDSVADPKSD